MSETQHLYIAMSYGVYADNEKGNHELLERVSTTHPHQFLTGLGLMLPAVEQQVAQLQQGDTFDFTLSRDEAFGEYNPEAVIRLALPEDEEEKKQIYPGNVIPLENADGYRMDGLVKEITPEGEAVIDLNHPWAGRDLHFKGEIVTLRPATEEEVKGAIRMLSGEEGCSCGCHHGEEHECCGGGCHHDHSGHGEGHGHCNCHCEK